MEPHQAQRRFSATANRHLAALIGVLCAARKLGYLIMNEFGDARVKPVRGHTVEPGRARTLAEIETLLRACLADRRPIGARATALIALLYSTGCRCSAAANLDLADYDLLTGALLIRKGKGNQDRRCFVPSGLRPCLGALQAAHVALPGALFRAYTRSGTLVTRLDERSSDRFVPARAPGERLRSRQALPGFAPHDLRRTLMTTLPERRVDDRDGVEDRRA